MSSRRFSGACKFFLEGKCSRGVNCKFSHDIKPCDRVTPDNARAPNRAPKGPRGNRSIRKNHTQTIAPGAVELEEAIKDLIIESKQRTQEHPVEIQDESPIQEKIMGGYMSVRFGPGLEIVSISPIDISSSTVIIENFPKDILVEEVRVLASEFRADLGPQAIRVMKRQAAQAIVHFDDMMAADAAIKALDGRKYNGNLLVARALRPTTASEDVTNIDLSWFQPARTANLQFTHETASEIALAIGRDREIRGRRIKSLPQKPKPGFSRPYSVCLVGLDVSTTEEDLRGVFNYDALKMYEPKFNLSLEDTTVYIRSLFDGTRIKEFKVVSALSDSKQRVIITFLSADDARNIYKKLDGKKHDFLGNTPLDLSLTYSATFKIPADIYSAIQGEINALDNAEKAKEREQGRSKEKEKDDKAPARLKIFDKYRPVTIHVNGRGRPAVVRVKIAIQKLLRGEMVCDSGGRALWDPALRGIEGKKLVHDVRTQTGVHMNCDVRNRCLTLYGSPEKRTIAREALEQAYQLLLNRQHEISLQGNAHRFALRGGLVAVQEHLGEGKVVVDIPGNRLFVRCSPGEIDNVKKMLLRTRGNTHSKRENGAVKEEEECPICLSPADDPTKTPCGHTYCKSCAQEYIRSTIETRRFPISCAGTGDGDCDSPLTIPFIQNVLSKADTDQLFEHGFLSYIQNRPQEYYFCPTPDCSTVYQVTTTGKIFTCSQCFVGICTTCKSEAHDGQTCEEYQIATNPEIDEKRLQEWKKRAGVKTCPKCSVPIEKNDGCDHISCRCGAHLCWLCLRLFSDGDSVYTHLRTCVPPPAQDDDDDGDRNEMQRLTAIREQELMTVEARRQREIAELRRQREWDAAVERQNEAYQRQANWLDEARRARDLAEERARINQERERKENKSGGFCSIM